jgi:hypothetical protein
MFCCKIYQNDPLGGKKLAGHTNVTANISEIDMNEILENVTNAISNKFGCEKNEVYIENIISL